MTTPTVPRPHPSPPGACPEVLARSTLARGAGARTICPECGADAVIGEQCPECRQLAAPEGIAGVLTVATVVAGRRLVVTCDRTTEGRWRPRTAVSTAPLDGGSVTPAGHPPRATAPMQH